jgi:hypothetical protein
MRRRNQTALEKELADINVLLRDWYAWHRELCSRACAGPHGLFVEQLLEILRELTLDDGAVLVTFIRSQDWHAVDRDVREICLFGIDGCITKLREKAGLPAFSDPLEGQPANVFMIVKRMLAV